MRRECLSDAAVGRRPELDGKRRCRVPQLSNRHFSVERAAMPIIVDEIVITVDFSHQDSGSAPPAPPAALDTQNVVQQCVERVLEILREREER